MVLLVVDIPNLIMNNEFYDFQVLLLLGSRRITA